MGVGAIGRDEVECGAGGLTRSNHATLRDGPMKGLPAVHHLAGPDWLALRTRTATIPVKVIEVQAVIQ